MALSTEDKNTIKKLMQQSPSQFCWHYFHVMKDPDNCYMKSVQDTFLFRHNNTISTFGHLATIKELLIRHSFEIGERLKIYFPSHHLPVVKKRFEDFSRIDETGSGDFNNLMILDLEKSVFTPRRVAKIGKRLKKEKLKQISDDEDLIEDLEGGGIIYGIVEQNELRSYVSIPYIYQNPREGVSFAILDKMYTEEPYRNQGYGIGCVRSALNYLLTRKAIKHVYSWVEEKNGGAMAICEQVGFDSTAMEWLGSYGFVRDLR